MRGDGKMNTKIILLAISVLGGLFALRLIFSVGKKLLGILLLVGILILLGVIQF